MVCLKMMCMPDNCALSLSEVKGETAKDKILTKIMNLVYVGAWPADPDIKPFGKFREEFLAFEGIYYAEIVLSFQLLLRGGFGGLLMNVMWV